MKIIDKKVLSESNSTKITQIDVISPDVSAKAKPGQFVVLMATAQGERIPLTVVDTDKNRGSIRLIFQELGFTTQVLGKMNKGDKLHAIVGPLGSPTEIKKYGKIILIGGGVGIAEIYPVALALKAAGNSVTTVIGARTKDILILEKELKKTSDNFFITTDDGSEGEKGFVTNVLRKLLSKDTYDIVYAVGPIPMMNKVCDATRPSKTKTLVSLNALMVDGTGMCGSCRVTVGGEVKFSCVDGPEFNGHLVNWEELKSRNNIYRGKEKHICKLNAATAYRGQRPM